MKSELGKKLFNGLYKLFAGRTLFCNDDGIGGLLQKFFFVSAVLCGICLFNDCNLLVCKVRNRNLHVGKTLVGNGHTVPNKVDGTVCKQCFLFVPINYDELDCNLGCIFCVEVCNNCLGKIDIKANKLCICTVTVIVSDGGKQRVADNQLFCGNDLVPRIVDGICLGIGGICLNKRFGCKTVE